MGTSVSIKIISTPPGEAPEYIRQAWIGLVLPANNSEPSSYMGTGVLSGPRSIRTGYILAGCVIAGLIFIVFGPEGLWGGNSLIATLHSILSGRWDLLIVNIANIILMGLLAVAVFATRNFWGALFGSLLARPTSHIGFIVPSSVAIEILAQSNPEAARWWRTNVPHALNPRHLFIFPAGCCKVVE